MVGPLLMLFGTEAQKEKHLLPIARGQIDWCEGFSEPQAGSDLASLQTQAQKTDDGWIINGQKLWTSGASKSDWMHMLVRTDPDAPTKHKGLTYMLVDMKTQGITVRPIEDMCGGYSLCEVFFDDVKVPEDAVLGGVNQGWKVAMALLNFERSADVGGAAIMRRFFDLICMHIKSLNIQNDFMVQHRLANIFIDIETARLMAYRLVSLAQEGAKMEASAQASMSKLIGSEAQQRVANALLSMLGAYGQVLKDEELAVLQSRIGHWYLQTFTGTLARGTSEIQRTILATRGLGLPRI